jgi:hypothetical protein
VVHHLERWWRRLEPGTRVSRQLEEVAARLVWPRRPDRTAGGARGLYVHQPDGAMLWVALGEVEPLEHRRLEGILQPAPLVAEEPAPYRDGR